MGVGRLKIALPDTIRPHFADTIPARAGLALACCLLLLLASATCLFAGGATITGRITYGNGAPAAGIVVQVSYAWAYTDVRGYYRLNDVPFGDQRMEIRYGDRVLKAIRIAVNQEHVRVDQTL
jgi:hypothetical protein